MGKHGFFYKYIGSFSVVGEDQASRAEYVRKQLEKIRTVGRSKPVVIMISLSGIKVCSSDKQTVYMAHALKRISYATCDPECRQFSFLAREPRGQISTQYCHPASVSFEEEMESESFLMLMGKIT
ncbi:SH2 domain-containing protein 5-like [Lingula anatina]|uniref:SH2 domain-containing protein 5-like n=1 Tax=Lingula anatina TaxID=7574 RepID=A0A2R2MTE4_LINAN|nr:SH2 domain-containing protein 5-like [Lingula anatina]|eukprot:XP_023933540.1 SH2 domain-containing protein 5-like [Lingula anatina]